MWCRVILLGIIGSCFVSAQTLTVFAASSLTEAFTDIEALFESRHGVDVTLNFGGSSTLVAQINQGAPADVFASADVANMAKMLPETQGTMFAKNKLVVVTNTPELQTLEDLANKDYLLVLAGEEVPVGRYSREILGKLETLYGPGYTEAVLQRLVSNETNVRQALGKVILGEADASIVYLTDVRGAEELALIEIPEDYNVIAEYPIAVVPASQKQELAQDFVDFVLSIEGQRILEAYGFLSP